MQLTVASSGRGVLAIVLLKESQVLASGRVRSKVLHCVIGGEDPSRLVLGKSLGVVQIHLNEVLCRVRISKDCNCDTKYT